MSMGQEFNKTVREELERGMEKTWLDDLCISNDCENPDEWKIVAKENELDKLIALARLGLEYERYSKGEIRKDILLAQWAEVHAIPALRRFANIEADDGDDFEGVHEDVIIRVEVTAGDIHAARDALAALPKAEKPEPLITDPEGK